MPEASLKRLPDFIVIGQEAWDEVERRNQLLIRALAVRNPRARFLFVEQPLRPREVMKWRWPRLRQVTENIWCIRPVRLAPDELSRHFSDRCEAAQVRRAARALGLEQPYLWTQDPRAADLVDRVPVAGIVYDLTDDWAAFEASAERRAVTQQRIESLGRRADLVLACSRPLADGARVWSDHVHYLPNAVDPPSTAAPLPYDLALLPTPRMGYAGTLHSSRLDVDLLVAAARERPSWSYVLLGPDLLEPDDRSRLRALDNIHFLGTCPHPAVRDYLAGFDICLVPNLVNDFTRSLDPLKIYEYLAAGRPVVVTPAGNAPDLGPHLAVAATADDLIAAAERLLREDGPAVQAQRRAAVAGATWHSRAEQIETALGVAAPCSPSVPVSVVIVNYNTRELLQRCLEALRRQDVAMQVIVVDNASADGSVVTVRECFPEVELVVLDENAGFARANNIAFASCRGEFILLLNSDAFLHDGAVAELLSAAKRYPRAGAAGPRLLNVDGSLQRSAWPFPAAGRLLLEAVGLHRPLRRLGLLEDLGTWAHDHERRVDFLIGACLLTRSLALVEVGGFDEGFWLYGEEADLQRRLAMRGWEVIFTPAAVATHVAGASSTASATRMNHFYRGQRRFLQKHGSKGARTAARAALFVGSLLRGRWRSARWAIGR